MANTTFRISKDDLDRIKRASDSKEARATICDSLGLKKPAKQSRYWCPMCQTGSSHKSPDLSIERGVKCHKCGYSADLIKLVEEIRKEGFFDAVSFLAEKLGVSLNNSSGRASRAIESVTQHNNGQDAIPATSKKNVYKSKGDLESTLKFIAIKKIGAEAAQAGCYEYIDPKGKPYAFVYRYHAGDNKTCLPAHVVDGGFSIGDPAQWYPYRCSEIDKTGPIYIYEGEKCVEAAMSIELHNSITSSHGSRAAKMTDWSCCAGRDAVIFPDSDDAGSAYADDVARCILELTPPGRPRIAKPFSDRKGYDAADLIVENGNDALSTIVDAAMAAVEVTREENCNTVNHDDGRSLAEFVTMKIDHEDTLLGNRYLCRGGSMLFVGPSGIGKSSASCQQDMLWSLGREAFGIRPAHPLRILTFQAENDDGDQHEMARGVMQGLNLTSVDMAVVAANTRYLTRFETGKEFLEMMEREVDRWKPDLVRLDPLNAFIGDDTKDPRAIASFCRSGINPILHKHSCGCIVAHHTPKTNFRDTTSWTSLDWAYAGAGGADLTNWARAVMVVDPINLAEGVFKFIGAKRGARLGWQGTDGEKVIERHFAYSRDPRLIFWREADPSEVSNARKLNPKAPRSADDLLEYVPPLGKLIGKATLIERAVVGLPCGEKKTEKLLKVLIEREVVHEHKEKRPGKRDAVLIGRHPPLAVVDDKH